VRAAFFFLDGEGQVERPGGQVAVYFLRIVKTNKPGIPPALPHALPCNAANIPNF
jgi:hypothetical protein